MKRRLCWLVMALVLVCAGPAFAHKVMLFALEEGDTIHAEGYFADGSPSLNSRIVVRDEAGNKLLEGQTDDEGRFSFTRPQAGALHMEMIASMGHRAEFVLAGVQTVERDDHMAAVDGDAPLTTVDEATLRRVVDEALDARLTPLVQTMLDQQRERRPEFTQVVGGIGYLVGIMGLVMYFRSRRPEE